MDKHLFVIMWCNDGLETILPVDPDLISTVSFNKLAGHQDPEGDARRLSQTIAMLKIRARANPQRHYEIYLLQTDGVSEEDLISIFDHDPQGIVNLIREKGQKLYSDREITKRKIT